MIAVYFLLAALVGGSSQVRARTSLQPWLALRHTHSEPRRALSLSDSPTTSTGGARTVIIVGALGSFTSVSAVAAEIATLRESGRRIEAASYLTATVVLSVALCWVGLRVA